MIKAPQAREERPHNEAWNGGVLMARSRRIPGRLEAGVSLKAFGETGVGEMVGGEGERERDLVTKPAEDSFVGNSSAGRQRISRRIALPLDIAGIGFYRL
jgi:hypothetical protein